MSYQYRMFLDCLCEELAAFIDFFLIGYVKFGREKVQFFLSVTPVELPLNMALSLRL